MADSIPNGLYGDFTGIYPVHKTLCFSLIPQGKSEYWIEQEGLVKEDEKRAEQFREVKNLVDNYHRCFIDRVLADIQIPSEKWEALAGALRAYKTSQMGSRQKARANMTSVQNEIRKDIARAFERDDEFEKLFGIKLFTELLPNFYKGEHQESLKSFDGFTSYFKGFHTNRRNMYSSEAKASSIANRIVNDNFSTYLANIDTFEKLAGVIPGIPNQLSAELDGEDVRKYFAVDNYSSYITQKGINEYNRMLGGDSDSVLRTKRKGLNELVNLASQQGLLDRKIRFKQLDKQILSDQSTASVYYEAIENDFQATGLLRELLDSTFDKNGHCFAMRESSKLLGELSRYDIGGILIEKKEITQLSLLLLGHPLSISHCVDKCAEEKLGPAAGFKKSQSEDWRKRDYFSLGDLQEACTACGEGFLLDHLQVSLDDKTEQMESEYPLLRQICEKFGGKNKKLLSSQNEIESIKRFLDAAMGAKRIFGVFEASPEEARDDLFYAEYDELGSAMGRYLTAYNQIRNYATQKPYSTEKFKLNFGKPQLLSGWDENKENDYRGVLFLKDGKYYLGILRGEGKIDFPESADASSTGSCYRKVVYKQLPGAAKMIPKCAFTKGIKNHFEVSDSPIDVKEVASNKKNFTTSLVVTNEIDNIRKNKKYTRSNCASDEEHRLSLKVWIDFCLAFLKSYESTSIYDFSKLEKRRYASVDDFYKDVDQLAYKLRLSNVDSAYIDGLVDSGKMCLFQIYSKDFAEGAHGNKDFNTLYFEAGLDEKYFDNPLVRINGGAELFYRPASINNPFIHEQGSKLVNKTFLYRGERIPIPDAIYRELTQFAIGALQSSSLSDAASEILATDRGIVKDCSHTIVKDRRYTKPQYSFHVPVTLNCQSKGGSNAGEFNSLSLGTVVGAGRVNILGIDRGERNLLYAVLINQRGEILKQVKLNSINGVDYRNKLDERERARTEQRKSWKSVERIKDLKKGYLSIAVREIADLMIREDAILVMEDLNGGFKNSRKKFEKQIYQAFEKQLIDKLNYLAYKPRMIDVDEPGGVLHGYQLTPKFESFEKIGKQHGFLFYVPAWNTSHIDPTTGFANLFKSLRYTNAKDAASFFARMDAIRYNRKENFFEFEFSYDNYETRAKPAVNTWTVCSYGESRLVRAVESTGGKRSYSYKEINVTSVLKHLFREQGIDYASGQEFRTSIAQSSDAGFLESLLKCFSILMQLRYSSESGVENEQDYILSPVRNNRGEFFDSRNSDCGLPLDADANGAYCIALKGLQIIQQQISKEDETYRVEYPKEPNNAWLKYIQNREFELQ